MADRPAISAQMKRDVLVECGFRCSMPQCRETTIEIHHIEGYAVVPEHTFVDLIALCANCHQRVTKGEIEKKAVRQIKANQSVFAHRYGDLERRFLEAMAEVGANAGHALKLVGGLELLMRNVLMDELAEAQPSQWRVGNQAMSVQYVLTQKGYDFIQHWLTASPLD